MIEKKQYFNLKKIIASQNNIFKIEEFAPIIDNIEKSQLDKNEYKHSLMVKEISEIMNDYFNENDLFEYDEDNKQYVEPIYNEIILDFSPIIQYFKEKGIDIGPIYDYAPDNFYITIQGPNLYDKSRFLYVRTNEEEYDEYYKGPYIKYKKY